MRLIDRLRTIFSHRAWTYAAVICAATPMLMLVYLDVIVVVLHVGCRFYRGRFNTALQDALGPALFLAMPLLVLNVVRAFLVRSFRIGFLSVGLAAVGVWLFFFSFDRTFGYCWFDSTDKLPACLFGCAR